MIIEIEYTYNAHGGSHFGCLNNGAMIWYKADAP